LVWPIGAAIGGRRWTMSRAIAASRRRPSAGCWRARRRSLRTTSQVKVIDPGRTAGGDPLVQALGQRWRERLDGL